MFHSLFKSLRRSRFTQTDKLFTQFQHRPKTTIVCLIFFHHFSFLWVSDCVQCSMAYEQTTRTAISALHYEISTRSLNKKTLIFFPFWKTIFSPTKVVISKFFLCVCAFFASLRYISNSSCFWYHFIFKHSFYLNLIFVCSFYVYDFFFCNAQKCTYDGTRNDYNQSSSFSGISVDFFIWENKNTLQKVKTTNNWWKWT